MTRIVSFIVRNWIRMVIAFVFCLGIMAIYNGVYSSWSEAYGYCNGTFIAGFAMILFSGLVFVANLGGFNIFSFTFSKKKLTEEGKKETLYDYSVRKEESRKKARFDFLAYTFIGVLFLIASLILYAILYF